MTEIELEEYILVDTFFLSFFPSYHFFLCPSLSSSDIFVYEQLQNMQLMISYRFRL